MAFSGVVLKKAAVVDLTMMVILWGGETLFAIMVPKEKVYFETVFI